MTEPLTPFESAAKEARSESLVGEFFAFLRYNKKWWLLPIIAVCLLLALAIWFGGGPIAPFIYTLF